MNSVLDRTMRSRVHSTRSLSPWQQDFIVSPQGEEEWKGRRERARVVLNCGSKFSHVGASFQLALSLDKMKSCRHKRYRHLILGWFRAGNIPQILLRSLFQRAVSANGKKGSTTAKAEETNSTNASGFR